MFPALWPSVSVSSVAHAYFSQVPFGVEPRLVPFAVPGDPAGHPNLETRFEVTRNGTDLFCGEPGDKSSSGYAHFTNNLGKEDKHMFWWLFEARRDPENAPVVLTFGGGPGGSGQLFPFSGAGPCTIEESGNTKAVPSPYSWTEYVNLLAIDHPVGVGFSYGDRSSFRNSSERAAWDIDDFLQAFWQTYPHLAKNQFMINSGSYGGIYIPNVVDVIHRRDQSSLVGRNGSSKRIRKAPSAVIINNGCSDYQTSSRWFLESNCNTDDAEGNMFFNDTVCSSIVRDLPRCLDAVQLAYEQPSTTNRYAALLECEGVSAWDKTLREPYDVRKKCPPSGCEVLNLDYLNKFMNSDEIRNATGVPSSVEFKALEWETIGLPFIINGDIIQPAYRLLQPAIESGLRVLTQTGMADGACPWRSTLAWMKLLKTKYQDEFRTASEVTYHDIGSVRQAGPGAGNFTFVKIKGAGHMVILEKPELLRRTMKRWLDNEPIFGNHKE